MNNIRVFLCHKCIFSSGHRHVLNSSQTNSYLDIILIIYKGVLFIYIKVPLDYLVQYRQKYKILLCSTITVSQALNQNPLTLSKLLLKVIKKKSMANKMQSHCTEAEGRCNRDSWLDSTIIIIICIRVMRYT